MIAFGLGFTMLKHGQHEVADRLSRVQLTWFDSAHTATARQAVAATGPELVGLFVYLATPLLNSVLLPIAIAVALLPISPELSIAAFVGVAVLFLSYWIAARLSRSADRAASEANSALTERIVEFARTQQALRAAKRVSPATSHAGSALAEQHRATTRLLLMQVPGQLLFSLASQIALVVLATTTVILSVRGTLSAPEAVALIVVIARYLEPFAALAGLAAAMEGTLTTLRRIRDVVSAPQVPTGRLSMDEAASAQVPNAQIPSAQTPNAQIPSAQIASAQAAPPRIELRNVSFAYDTAHSPVFEGLNLTLEPGTTTAIVGPSGSGKSTVLLLLAGLQLPSSGSVLVNGLDAAELDEVSRRELTSFVFQQPYLFDTSVHENLLVGNPDATDEAIGQAVRLARVDTIIERLPDGLQSRVGEAGGSLSGGERQRVSIARALLKPAPVLLVDEATSALDAENESAVAAALSDDPTPRTRVIVAHRLSSILQAQRIVFLEEGRVVESGGLDELLAAGGRFAQFWRHQHEASAWTLRG